MRDRLIELLETVYKNPKVRCPRSDELTCDGCKYDLGDHCDISAIIADHLLANGVIVPPYKPLPLVWPDDEFAQEVLCPICETDLMGCYIDGEEAPTVVTCHHCGAWLDSTKAVTREEAEKALAERSEG